ncbi:MAG: tol-pal system protein YbgF, partial [Holophagales bacterium]|nr:tol-pal system protein YbgF [Holophagales bacterium]
LADLQLQMLQAQKQSPTKAELAELKTALSDRIGQLATADANMGANLEDLILQVERLEAAIEEASDELGRLSQQIAAANDELRAVRIAAEEDRRSRAPSPPPRGGEPEDPQSLYDQAYSYYTSGNYDLAILDFRQYLENHPETDLADNATYWLGECYYHRGKFERAIHYFDSVLEDYRRSDREVSARLKRAYAHLELGQRDEGVKQLRQVACRHDGTDEAKLASKRLEELGFDADCPGAL